MEEVTLTFKIREGFTKEDLINHLFSTLIDIPNEEQIIEEVTDGDIVYLNA
jgi:hypothetical protein